VLILFRESTNALYSEEDQLEMLVEQYFNKFQVSRDRISPEPPLMESHTETLQFECESKYEVSQIFLNFLICQLTCSDNLGTIFYRLGKSSFNYRVIKK
jgi:hypothetical protein